MREKRDSSLLGTAIGAYLKGTRLPKTLKRDGLLWEPLSMEGEQWHLATIHACIGHLYVEETIFRVVVAEQDLEVDNFIDYQSTRTQVNI